MARELDEEELRRIYHHVFLPPQLPQNSDEDKYGDVNRQLVCATLDALRRLPGPVADSISNAITAIKNLKDINSFERAAVSELQLSHILSDLEDGQSAPVHIGSQNAAVMVTRKQDELVFEAFELSPLSSKTLSARGRLIRSFPGTSIAINTTVHQCSALMPVVANTISTMCIEAVPSMQPLSHKTGKKHGEHRDTTSPAVVTELFMGFLRGFGRPTLLSTISKNTRDEVLWEKAAGPWRRSSMWLLIKVVMHLVISRSAEGTDCVFKRVMVIVMSHILDSAGELDFSSEQLYAMSAKIVRRLHKLHASSGSPSADSNFQQDPLLAHVQTVLQRISLKISARWEKVQQNNSQCLELGLLAELDVKRDTYVVLPALDKYVSSIRSRSDVAAAKCFIPSSGLIKHKSFVLPSLPPRNDPAFHYATSNLQQFEVWIVKQLDDWLEHGSQAVSDACHRLYGIMQNYYQLACSHYFGNPEGTSVMILTLFDIWVACDKLALRTCPMLGEYAPDVQIDILQSLLLPFPGQMDRLQKVEVYLRERAMRSCPELDGRLFSTTHQNSFAARYFDGSTSHQALKMSIAQQAQQSHDRKKTEFQATRSRYDSLDAKHAARDCDFRTVIVDSWCEPPETEQRHAFSCLKCSYRIERDNLEIELHEWPLPEELSEAKVVVFELNVPLWYISWRDARLFLLREVLKGKRESAKLNAKYQPSSNDPHLRRWYTSGTGTERTGLVSETKPVVVTHYGTKKITEVDIDDVCVPNGLSYKYFDNSSGQYIGSFRFDEEIQESCTYALPAPALQRYLVRPAHSADGEQPNVVIANQDKCPDAMSLDEYKELSSVPLGHHIQWVNILQQLAMPGVDFKKFETTLVFLQCIYQTGPPGDDHLREAHALLRSNEVACNLIAHLDAAIERIKQNWESAQALSLFATIATRILFLISAEWDPCLSLLAKVREISSGWMHLLRQAAHDTFNDESRQMFLAKSVETALICASTYDVPKKHLIGILHSTHDVSMLVQATITVQHGGNTQLWKDQSLQLMRLRFTRFLHRSYKRIAENSDGLDDAIKHAWSSYSPGTGGWTAVALDVDDWITTDTNAAKGAVMKVHYNLVSGELLVNGLPLDQPPQEYRTQDLYQTLFSNAVVEVLPATCLGFRFSTKRTFGDHEVQLGLQSGSGLDELIVQGKHATGVVIENIPSRVLANEFPTYFVQEYVHWYNFDSGDVDFRPIQDPWNLTSSAKWTLKKTESASWRLFKGDSVVVGLKSATVTAISNVFRPLAHDHRIHCLLQSIDETLKVDIPALRLNFRLSKGDSSLQSKEFPSMAVDADQRLGTLVGFMNKFILRSGAGERLLLLPESSSSCTKQGGHVTVRVTNTDAIRQVHALHIDDQLDRLVDSGDLGCKLYLAYMHALTSSCLPDPLIHTTGTEQALTILDSCAVRSFGRLSQDNITMLTQLAELSPGRSYYPVMKKVMQSVKWHDELGFMAQHARLRTAVQAILDQARDAEIFYPDIKLQYPDLRECDDHLQQRDSIRSSTFRVPGFGAEDHDLQHDRTYSSRDQGLDSERGTNAALMSDLMTRARSDTHWPKASLKRLWHELCQVSSIHGPNTSPVTSRHCYAGVLTQDKKFARVLERLPTHFRKLGQSQTPRERYFVTIWLASMAFANNADLVLLQVFAMVCKCQGLTATTAPSTDLFTLSHGLQCTRNSLETIVGSATRTIAFCPESNTRRGVEEKKADYDARCRALWQSAKSSAVTRVVDALFAQRTQEIPTMPQISDASTYINMENAMDAVKVEFQTWYDNNLFYEYLSSVIQSLTRLENEHVLLPSVISTTTMRRTSAPSHFAKSDLFSTSTPLHMQGRCQFDLPTCAHSFESTTVVNDSPRLQTLVQALEASSGMSQYKRSYTADLKTSLVAFITQDCEQLSAQDLAVDVLTAHQKKCKDHVRGIYARLLGSICQLANSTSERTVQHWPRVSPVLLLQQLAHDRVCNLPNAWKTCIVDFGIAITVLQQADRLVRLHKSEQFVDLRKELRNPGHKNWSPYDHPQSLLMEVESGIMIREVQEQIASEMRRPSSGSNAVMQLNMGEGKSTVIIPMVAAALANGSQLVRVVVAKPQSKQMAQMLIAKFGGLVKRRIYYMPFSRSLKLTSAAAGIVFRTLRECMRTGGILLVQPEHMLSFGLMAPERYINDKGDVGQPLMAIQDFFDRYSRDIVDESDENFSVRFELIYTMGTQQSIELSPDRWLYVQQVLAIVKDIAPEIARDLDCSIEIHSNGAGAFPRIRLLRADATDALILRVAGHIRDNGLEGFQMARQSQDVRDAVFEYITTLEPSIEAKQLVEEGEFWDTCKAQVLLLRGILAGGVLAFALSQKRWRVNYGLTSRSPPTKLAVPYRAKDSPTPRSEFSHPDVVITLTSLCYYYDGLNNEDMFTSLGHLMDCDQADAEYQTWVKSTPKIPVAFQQLQGINLKDRLQCILQLFPHLRKGKAVVDYFLSRIVFPKEMREFPHKLSVSGWDIGKPKQLVTTGFSGTNDSRRLLPLFVKQLDLPEQKHTNALVLECLLQPVSGVELISTVGAEEHTTDAERLLSTVICLDPPVQVIIDVGAQILEYDNLGLSKEWLRLSGSSKEAVVFVNDSDELCVVDRKGRVDSLQTSPFASRLDVCLVFLDECHTRGIDLKLPLDRRAAVTLGAHLTKDRLVQACIRMRKLGQGQSVVFCISREIQTKIRGNMKSYNALHDITVADVLLWSISETHMETRRSMPLWTVQGERFVRQSKIWKGMKKNSETSLSKVLAEELLEEEAQSIEYRYSPLEAEDHPSQPLNTTDPDLELIADRCREFGNLQHNASTLQEEQERELSPETEQERQVQRAPPAEPARHALQKDVENFALLGQIKKESRAYMPAFESLRETSASSEISLHQLVGKRNLLVTADFATTVKKTGISFLSDAFQRNVQWVLARLANDANQVDCIMVVSDYEANLLLPCMKSKTTSLHKYKARCNAGYSPLDNLDLFMISGNVTPPLIPRSLSVQLSLFAGQLYISTYEDYLEICQFLGLSAKLLTKTMEQEGWKVGTDGFILRDGFGRVGGASGLTRSPMNFFKVLMSKIRRNGSGISKTDMGSLLDGKPFQKSDWQK